jgi:hypothetical protein
MKMFYISCLLFFYLRSQVLDVDGGEDIGAGPKALKLWGIVPG